MAEHCRRKNCAHRKAAIDALIKEPPRGPRALALWLNRWFDVPLPPPDPKRQRAGSNRWAGLTDEEKSQLGKQFVQGRINKEKENA